MPKTHIIYLLTLIIILFSCKTKAKVEQGGERITAGFSASTWQRQGELYKAPASFMDASLPGKINSWISDAIREGSFEILTADRSKKSWSDLGVGKSKARVFLLRPGDYRRFGSLVINDKSGTASKPFIIAALAEGSKDRVSEVHPVKWSGNESKEVLLESFTLKNSDHWIFYGLTFRGNNSKDDGYTGGYTNMMRDGADHNIVANCVIEKVLKGSFVRILNGSFNRVQTCVIRNKVEGVPGDNIGVLLAAYEGMECRGNIITSNEIYNVTDGIAISRSDSSARKDVARPHTGEAPGTVIENNDLYVTSSLYKISGGGKTVGACSENAMDFKTGTYSDDPEDKILVMYNRMWGFRNSVKACGASGSAGQAVVFHRMAANIFFYNNIVADAPSGISIMGTNPLYPTEKVKNISIINNIFYDIRRKSDDDINAGEVFHAARTAEIYNNAIVSCDVALNVVRNNEQIRFKGNFINNTATLVNSVRKNEGYELCGNIDLSRNQAAKALCDCYAANTGTTNFRFMRKLLTGAEEVEIPGVSTASLVTCEVTGKAISVTNEQVDKVIKKRKTE